MNPTILVAEDSPDDRLLIQLGFEKEAFPCRLQFVEDGIAATEYLEGAGIYADRKTYARPALVFTDVKMPRMDGLDLLEWIRRHRSWRKLPVIMVTGSNQTQDRQRAMELGANAYIAKDLLLRPPPELYESISKIVFPEGPSLLKYRASRLRQVK